MNVPIEKLLNKSFQKVDQSAEYSAALHLMEHESIDLNHRYFLERTGRVNRDRPPFCPNNLSVPYVYWKTPWADKSRPVINQKEIIRRTMIFPELLDTFRDIIYHINDLGGWVGKPVCGIRLINRYDEYIVIYLDGNHRIAAMKVLGYDNIPMVLKTFTVEQTLMSKFYCMADNQAWWHYVWEQDS